MFHLMHFFKLKLHLRLISSCCWCKVVILGLTSHGAQSQHAAKSAPLWPKGITLIDLD